MRRKPYWAAAKHELHEHESVICFSTEEARDAFVRNSGGEFYVYSLREPRVISDEEAAEIGSLVGDHRG